MILKAKLTKYGHKIIEEKSQDYIVYCLYCPIEKSIKYIGVTNQGLRKRLQGHISDACEWRFKLSEKSKWVKKVLKKHGAIYARALIKCNGIENAKRIEFELIEKISQKRHLVNACGSGKLYGIARK